VSSNKRTTFENAADIIKTVIVNGGAVVINSIITILIIPFVAERLGTEAYGFVSLANNFVSFAAIISLALNTYSVRYISVAYHKAEYNKAQSYYSTVIIGNLLLSCAVIVLGTIFSCFSDLFLNVSKGLENDIKILFILMFINFGLQTVGDSLTVFAYINNRLEIIGFSRFAAYFVELIVFCVLFTTLPSKMWYVAIAYLAYSTLLFILYILMQRKYFAQIPFSVKSFSLKSMYELLGNGLWNSINSLGNTLNAGLDLLITNIMLDAGKMGQLAIAKTVGSLIPIVYGLISQAFQPRLLKYYSDKNKKRLIQEFKSSMLISGFFVGILFCIIIAIGEDFYKLWLPNQNTHVIYIITIITMLSYVLEGVVGPLYYVYTLTVKIRVPCIITLVGGIVNVIAMYLLLKFTSFGVYAVVGTTVVIMVFINLVTNPIYIAKSLKVKWTTFYPTIIFYLIFIIVTSFLLRWITRMFVISNWGELISVLVLETVIAGGIYIMETIIIWKKWN